MRNFLRVLLVSTLVVAVVFAIGASKTPKTSKHAWLGVVGQTVDDELADAFDLSVEYGAIVNDVLEDSPAEKIGLEEGDIIVALAGAKVKDYDDLIDIIEDHKPGDKVSLKVIREDKELEFEVELEGRPRGAYARSYWFSDGDFVVPSIPRVPAVPRVPSIGGYYFGGFGGSYIGIRMTGLTKQLGEYFGVERGRGALIMEVEKDSPAEKAGLKAGDVIVSIDGDEVYDTDDVTDAVHDKDEGEKLSVMVKRDRSDKTFEVEVAEDKTGYKRLDKFFLAEPDIDIRIPDMRGLHYGIYSDDWDEDFDSEEFNEDMEDLMEELKDLQEEMKELKREHNEELKAEFEELRKELERLKEKLD